MAELIIDYSGSDKETVCGRFLTFHVGKEIYGIEKITEEIGRGNGVYVFF